MQSGQLSRRGPVCMVAGLALAIALMTSVRATGAPPRLYDTQGMQSPTRAAGNDLLLLAGYPLAADDRVVYREASAADSPWPRGTTLPANNSVREGVAEVFPAASDAQALVIRLPRELDGRRAYALAVLNRSGEWSNAVRINDPRAYWLSPANLPAQGAGAGLPRRLRIIGANLAAHGATPLRVRLRGPVTLEFDAQAAFDRTAEYLAEINLPPTLPVGEYRVALSRDGDSWRDGPALEVGAVRPRRTEFAVGDVKFGGCRPDDDADDTACVLAALRAAAQGGVIRFAPGTWQLDAPDTPGLARSEGIQVPRGVDLMGDDSRETRIVRSARWHRDRSPATFVLTGDNVVRRLHFVDTHAGRQTGGVSAFLQLGNAWWVKSADRVVRDISIVGNQFTGADVAIRDRGRSLSTLVIVGNRIRARVLGLSLGGDGNNVGETFRIEDAMIRDNVFEPGSYLDTKIRQGARAAEIGAGTRLDFSGNVADGSSLAGLDLPDDPAGWRAAFFWHLRGPSEQILIAGNQMYCTGDKAGDGEAIALDNNHNWGGFDTARQVLAAGAASVTVSGPLVARRENKDVDPPSYYIGHWLQVAAGPGIGQSRRVTAIRQEAGTGRTTLSVEPAWDVVPEADASRLTLGRTFWQTYILGNEVDGRRPRCRKSNRTEPESGAIVMWAQSTDSLVGYNRQFETDGIVFHQTFAPGGTSFNYFLDIRGNEILGEYDARRDASESGIRGPHGAAPGAPPPVENFGLSIAHNRIDAADSGGGAAINFFLSWHAGPAPHQWTLLDRPLVFGNEITNTRTGITIPANSQVRRAVLSGNRCADARQPLDARAQMALPWCADGSDSCECRGR